MVYRLALEKPEAFAALAVIAANLPVDENFNCQKSDKPVSIAIINGTEDPINPYHGGINTGSVDLILLGKVIDHRFKKSHIIDIFNIGSVAGAGTAAVPVIFIAVRVDGNDVVAVGYLIKLIGG